MNWVALGKLPHLSVLEFPLWKKNEGDKSVAGESAYQMLQTVVGGWCLSP